MTPDNVAVFTACGVTSVFFAAGVGMVFGGWLRERDCANAQECDDPPKWWQRELIHARARKEARKLDKEQP